MTTDAFGGTASTSLLRDSDEVQYELLGENAAVVEPCVGESLIAEALDRIGEDADSGVIVEIAQMGIFVEQDAW